MGIILWCSTGKQKIHVYVEKIDKDKMIIINGRIKMFCSNCGMTIEENSKFCKHCGFQMHTLDTEEKKVSVSQKNLPQTVGNTELNKPLLKGVPATL